MFCPPSLHAAGPTAHLFGQPHTGRVTTTQRSGTGSSVPDPADLVVRELAAALTEAKDGGWPTLLLDDTHFHGTLHTLLPAAVRAAWNSGRLGPTHHPGPGPLWWTVPDHQPGRTLLSDLATGLGHPVPHDADASVWVTDHLLRGAPPARRRRHQPAAPRPHPPHLPGTGPVRHHRPRPRHPARGWWCCIPVSSMCCGSPSRVWGDGVFTGGTGLR
ncbi:hypothetical protein GCM10027168_63640 [Streptomyces capparidis]